MKKILNITLTLSTLISLSACGGQVMPTNGMMPQQGMQGQMMNSQAFGQNPYMQNNYAYEAPQQNVQQPGMPQTQPNLGMAQPNPQMMQPNPATRQTGAPQTVSLSARSARPNPLPPQQQPRPMQPAPAAVQQQAAPQAPAAQSPDAIAADLLNKTRMKFGQLQSFAGTLDAFEKNEKGTTRMKLKILFQGPTDTKLEILEHSNGLFTGAKLFYKIGSGNVTGRPGGLMSMMKLTVPMSDERISSRRGYRLDQIDIAAIVNRLVNPDLKPKVMGKTNVGGREIIVLEFPAQNHMDPAITRELLGIDMQDHFVRIHEMYAGPELVYSLKLQQLDTNVPLTAKDFNI